MLLVICITFGTQQIYPNLQVAALPIYITMSNYVVVLIMDLYLTFINSMHCSSFDHEFL